MKNEQSKEPKLSRALYELNRINLKKDIQIQKMLSSKLNFHNLKLFFSYLFLGGLSSVLKKISHKKTMDKNEFSLRSYESYPRAKVAVYTSIFGGYDDLLEPLFVNESIDYFVLTDREIPCESAWKKMDISFDKESKMSPLEKNRYCKMLPHLFFKNYDYSIYIDGNIRIVTDLMPIICDLGNKAIGIHDYQNDCIYEMKDSIIIGRRANKKDVLKQIKQYKKDGFPKHYGAFECNVLVRKHNDSECISIMEQWWKEFEETTSKRDQLSLPYVLWKNGLAKDFVCSLGYHVRENPRFIVVPKHKGNK